MAATALTVQQIAITGVEPTYTAANGTDGNSFANNGRTYLHVKNGGGSSINVTIDSVAQCSYGHDHDIVVAVPGNKERVIGPFPTARFNTAGSVTATYSSATSVTVGAFSI